MKIAVIPARGGSKRIPRKNIKKFRGVPVIAWTIKKIIESKLFDRVIVSTEDQEIAKIAKGYGAEVPFIRPKELADDFMITVPVIAHTINSCDLNKSLIEYACCVFPASPFLQIEDLSKSLEILIETGINYVYPVTEFVYPPQRGMRKLPDDRMQFLIPENELKRTQDFEVLYHDTGQFYWGKSSAWTGGFAMNSTGIGMKIPSWRVVDIDTEDDWIRAELIHKSLFPNEYCLQETI